MDLVKSGRIKSGYYVQTPDGFVRLETVLRKRSEAFCDSSIGMLWAEPDSLVEKVTRADING